MSDKERTVQRAEPVVPAKMTLGEARQELSRATCKTSGHDWEIIEQYGRPVPTLILCRCCSLQLKVVPFAAPEVMDGGWSTTWRTDPRVEPIDDTSGSAEHRRGTGEYRGEVGVADFPAGTYPACSKHGALMRVGKDPAIWRCLFHNCNAGATTDGWAAS